MNRSTECRNVLLSQHQQNNQSWVSEDVQSCESLMIRRPFDNRSQKQSQVQGDEGAIPVCLLARRTSTVLLNTSAQWTR